MELRLLRYFLTVAKEQSFTKAAEQLHITQPTLSRQMAAFEEELGVTLFIRSGKKISLTEEGILLKRRALEILNLEEKTLEELKGKEDVVEGTITIGCGEFAAVETLAEICKTYKEKDGKDISITKSIMSGGSLAIDSENAKKSTADIQGHEATLFEKGSWTSLVIPMPEIDEIVYLESNGVSMDEVIKVAENLPL